MNAFSESTLEKYKNFLKVKNYANKTIEVYISMLKQFLQFNRDKSPLHITQRDYERFMHTYKFSSISQQSQMVSAIIIFFKEILKHKLYYDLKKYRPRKERHLPKIIDSISLKLKIDKIQNLKHKTILALAYSTGMRVSEICNLKIEHIDSKRMLIFIENGKGKKDRHVPLSQNILDLLRSYYKKYRPILFLFNGQTDKSKYSITSCELIYKKYIDATSSFHTLRHSCFTYLLESGVDIRIIQKIAGHSNIKTTEGYTHVSNNLLNKINLPL